VLGIVGFGYLAIRLFRAGGGRAHALTPSGRTPIIDIMSSNVEGGARTPLIACRVVMLSGP
jgi:hypothetical protein